MHSWTQERKPTAARPTCDSFFCFLRLALQVNCLSLKQLYVLGKDPEPAHRLANAQFLHKELPVRLSQRAVELMNLPHGLSDIPGVQQVLTAGLRT